MPILAGEIVAEGPMQECITPLVPFIFAATNEDFLFESVVSEVGVVQSPEVIFCSV